MAISMHIYNKTREVMGFVTDAIVAAGLEEYVSFDDGHYPNAISLRITARMPRVRGKAPRLSHNASQEKSWDVFSYKKGVHVEEYLGDEKYRTIEGSEEVVAALVKEIKEFLALAESEIYS